MADRNIEKLHYETYLKMIKNSVGAKLFNSIIVRFKDEGKIKDICRNGQLSCAVFVSSVLFLNDYISRPHATVKTTEDKMIEAGWKKISKNNLKFGDVVVWEEMKFGRTTNKHIGFVLNKNQAISTSWQKRKVIKHHITYGVVGGKPKRRIINVYRVK